MSERRAFDGVLFDLDGTLIDTIPLIVETFQYTFDRLGIEGVTEEHILSGIGTPLETYFRQFPEVDTQELMKTYMQYNARMLSQAIAIFIGVPDMLGRLQALHVPVGIVTAKRRNSAMLTLGVFGIEKSFDIIVTKEDTDRHKPHPDPLWLGMAKLGLKDPSRIIYVGDSIHDLQSARAAGCAACAVGWSRMPRRDLLAQHPDYWADRASQIVDIVMGGCVD